MAEDDYEPIINDEIRAWIGREDTPETVNTDGSMMQRYAHAVNDLNPLFLDDEAAKNTAFGGVIAPFQYFQIVFTQPKPQEEMRGDGTPAAGTSFRPPIPLQRGMAGGQEVEYHRPIRPGDVLTRTSKIADITERRGQTGPLVFTTTETTYTDADGKPVVTVTTTGIAR